MAGIKDTKIIKGQPHLLTYITPNEVEKLKVLGGQETMTPEGIPAYPEFDNYTESSLAGTSSAGSGLTRGQFEGGAYSGTGNAGQALASANLINTQQAAAKKVREEKERQVLKKQLESGPVTNYSTNYFVNANRFAKNKFNKIKQKAMQKAILKSKDSNLEELGLIDSQGMSIGGFKVPSFFSGAASAFKIDPSTKYFDEDSIREIGSQLQYTPTTDPITGKKTFGMTSSQTKTLGDLKQDIQFENNPNISQKDFDAYINRNKIITREGNDNILPQYAMMGGGADLGGEDAVEDEYDYHLGLGGQKVGRDVTLGYLADGGRAGKAEGGIMELRARRAFGGIMDRVTGRKAYGLGSIFKSVKKAAGKVLSSDIGKMAIAGAAFYYGGGGSNVFKAGASGSSGWMGGLKAMGGNFMSSANPLLFSGAEGARKLSLGKLGLASAALPFLMPAAKPNETSFSDRGGSLIDPITGLPAKPAEMRASLNNALDNADGDPIRIKQINDAYAFLGPDERLGTYSPYRTYGVKDGE